MTIDSIYREGRHRKGHAILTILALALIITASYQLQSADAAAGNECTYESPCSCGISCRGGNEIQNEYNTIDGCKDGSESAYEYVEDITVTDLTSSEFAPGDKVQIDAYFDCDLDGDEITLLYTSDIVNADWVVVHDTICSFDGKRHIYKNITLDMVEGYHAVRAVIAYNGEPGMDCGFGNDPVYSDTDDIIFQVVLGNTDTVKPSVDGIYPEAGMLYDYSSGLTINISANISDDNQIAEALVNVTWGSRNELIALDLVNDDYYYVGFSNTSSLARYDVTFIARDLAGNVNSSETTYFLINGSGTIGISSPQGFAHLPSSPIDVIWEVEEGLTIGSSWLEAQSPARNISGTRIVQGNTDQTDASFARGDTSNLSQSFMLDRDTYVNTISLSARNTDRGARQSVVIANESDWEATAYSMASAEIEPLSLQESFGWIDLTLNETILLKANTTYWIGIVQAGDEFDHVEYRTSLSGAYPEGDLMGDESIDLLFKIHDKNRYSAELIPTSQLTELQAFADAEGETIRSSIIVIYFDFTPPVIRNYTISPLSSLELKPGAEITVQANVTDNLEVGQVILQHKHHEDIAWTNETMSLAGNLYRGTFMLDEEGNYSVRIVAYDTSGRRTQSAAAMIPSYYDNAWTFSPKTLSSQGLLVGTNGTIGNFTIISLSDFPMAFNVSYVSASDIFINSTRSMLITLVPGSNASLEISANSDSSIGKRPVSIRIRALNATATPAIDSLNFSLVTYLTGPYLVAEITDYDPIVEQGDHINVLNAKIYNLGNDTAHDVSASWTLPEKWTSRDDLNRTFGDLSAGGFASMNFRISADVASDAPTGVQQIVFFADCTEGTDDSDSRNVQVSSGASSGGGTTPDDSPSGSGGGSGGSSSPMPSSATYIIERPELSIGLGDIDVPIGEPFITRITISNNITRKDLANLTFEIEGIYRRYYNLTPGSIEHLPFGASMQLDLTIHLPRYYPDEEAQLRFIATPGNAGKIVKDFILSPYDKDFPITTCLAQSRQVLASLGSKGFPTGELMMRLEQLEGSPLSDLTETRRLCMEIMSTEEEYSSLEKDLEDLWAKAGSLRDRGYVVEDMEELLRLVEVTMRSGNIDKSRELLQSSSMLFEAKEQLEKPVAMQLMDFYKANSQAILLIILAAPFVILLWVKTRQILDTESRIKSLEIEKEEILQLITGIQDAYFAKHVLAIDIYKAYMDSYRRRLGEIEVNLVRLKLSRSRQHLTPDQTLSYREEIGKLIKQVQNDYYVRRIIDFGSYEMLESMYSSLLSDDANNKRGSKSSRQEKESSGHTRHKKRDSGRGYAKGQTAKGEGEGSADQEKQHNQDPVLDEAYELLSGPKDGEGFKEKLAAMIGDATNQEQVEAGIADKEPIPPGQVTDQTDDGQEPKPSKEMFAREVSGLEAFYLRDGGVLRSMRDLYDALDGMGDSVFRHHVNEERNDFSNWIRGVFKDGRLADKVLQSRDAPDMRNILEIHFDVGDRDE